MPCNEQEVAKRAKLRCAIYPYYVCLNAQRKGRATCPTKSLPALAIEDSVLGQIRLTRHPIASPEEWPHLDRTRQIEVIQEIIEHIGFDGAEQQVALRFRSTDVQESVA